MRHRTADDDQGNSRVGPSRGDSHAVEICGVSHRPDRRRSIKRRTFRLTPSPVTRACGTPACSRVDFELDNTAGWLLSIACGEMKEVRFGYFCQFCATAATAKPASRCRRRHRGLADELRSRRRLRPGRSPASARARPRTPAVISRSVAVSITPRQARRQLAPWAAVERDRRRPGMSRRAARGWLPHRWIPVVGRWRRRVACAMSAGCRRSSNRGPSAVRPPARTPVSPLSHAADEWRRVPC